MKNNLDLVRRAEEALLEAETNLRAVKESRMVEDLSLCLARCLRIRKALEQEKWNLFELLVHFALFFEKRTFNSSFEADGLKMRYRLEGYEKNIPVDNDLRGITVCEYEVIPDSKFIGSSRLLHICSYELRDKFYDLCQSMVAELQLCCADQSNESKSFRALSEYMKQLSV